MDTGSLSPQDLAVIAEEQSLLDRAQAAVAAAASAPRSPRVSRAELRELREEAAQARAEDLAPLLHELGVRHRLARRDEVIIDRDVPYFAHLRLRERGVEKDYLLGQASLIGGGVQIIDWRVAPVAQIFYRYREGDAYEEEFPGRVAEGTVVARRIVSLDGGQITGIFGDDLALVRGPDGLFRRRAGAEQTLVSGGAGASFGPADLGTGAGAGPSTRPPITALLDAEQIAAIRSPPERALLVLGSAGSGKTTVALHRLAALAARPDMPLSRSLVVVPGEGLARLSRRLLRPLGVGEAQVQTLDEWAVSLGRRVFGGDLPRIDFDAPALVVSLKRHPAFHEALLARLGAVRPDRASLLPLRRVVTTLLTDRAFLAGVVEAARGALPNTAIDETIRHTMRQLQVHDEQALRHVSRDRLNPIDGRSLSDATPDDIAGTIDAEDLPILLALRASALGLPSGHLAHLVLDEAEDFSLFELDVLGQLLDDRRCATLAGDEAQQTLSSFAGWDSSLSVLGVEDAARCRLEVSYRCPLPIATLAARVLGSMAPPTSPRAARDGAPVAFVQLPAAEQIALFLADAVDGLVRREPRATVGVLCADEAAARRLHAVIDRKTPARLVCNGEFIFEPGVDVAPLDSAKGLEFDYVIVADASAAAFPERPEARHALHVAVTRASHQLLLASVGDFSPLLG